MSVALQNSHHGNIINRAALWQRPVFAWPRAESADARDVEAPQAIMNTLALALCLAATNKVAGFADYSKTPSIGDRPRQRKKSKGVHAPRGDTTQV